MSRQNLKTSLLCSTAIRNCSLSKTKERSNFGTLSSGLIKQEFSNWSAKSPKKKLRYFYIGLFKNKPSLNQGEFESLLGSIADQKGLEKKFLLDKLIAAGEPKMSDFADIVSKTC
ncbi:hypothetical protein CEXT_295731 [Caerostris extrusa]|uniref:Uncharacterized protein n=1 Tax=Caerostris extrusa TaxID=172846 RepID=A0AAV4YE79_CAEEX|nr:hypothetical protein CEXT_295731 [Caerostris extrusa]